MKLTIFAATGRHRSAGPRAGPWPPVMTSRPSSATRTTVLGDVRTVTADLAAPDPARAQVRGPRSRRGALRPGSEVDVRRGHHRARHAGHRPGDAGDERAAHRRRQRRAGLDRAVARPPESAGAATPARDSSCETCSARSSRPCSASTTPTSRLMEDVLRDSHLDWTVVRPPRLTNGPLTGAYRTAYEQNLRGGVVISRADVAHLMLRVLEPTRDHREGDRNRQLNRGTQHDHSRHLRIPSRSVMKKDKIIYWTTTSIISAIMLLSAYYFCFSEDAKGAFAHLGLPNYLRVELTVAKILGGLALLIPAVPARIKEFAYFGIAMTIASAIIAHAASGDGISHVIDPLVIFGILVVSYVYHHKRERTPMADATTEDVEVFESQRARLVALAYRMLGDVGRAEDMVQEAWLRWQGRQRRGRGSSAPAYLVTMVTRLCLNELDSAKTRREESRGDRLPEPVALDEGTLGRIEALEQVSMAFLVMLQRLTPAERAVLLLHDVFDFASRRDCRAHRQERGSLPQAPRARARARRLREAPVRRFARDAPAPARLVHAGSVRRRHERARRRSWPKTPFSSPTAAPRGRRGRGFRNLQLPLRGRRQDRRISSWRPPATPAWKPRCTSSTANPRSFSTTMTNPPPRSSSVSRTAASIACSSTPTRRACDTSARALGNRTPTDR